MIPKLEINQKTTIAVDSKKRFNPGLEVKAGEVYEFTLTDETWKDGVTSPDDQTYFECTAAGWPSDTDLSWTERLAMRVLNLGISRKLGKIRVPCAEYFELCGCFNEDDSTAFRIGGLPSPHTWTAPQGGCLYFFANDAQADRFYENNEGIIRFQIKHNQ